MSDLQQKIGQSRILGEAICAAMEDELHRLGVEAEERVVAEFDTAQFELSRDPFDGKDSLKGTWRNPNGHQIGSILFYPDGAFYAEYDVVRPHPTKSKWFIEAITAWGRGNNVTTEARLLPALSQ